MPADRQADSFSALCRHSDRAKTFALVLVSAKPMLPTVEFTKFLINRSGPFVCFRTHAERKLPPIAQLNGNKSHSILESRMKTPYDLARDMHNANVKGGTT